MGLDQYAAVVKPNGDRDELAYWRKHPELQGWMKDLWNRKGGQGEFNCEEVELDEGDLMKLHAAVESAGLPHTTGFFFGGPSSDHYLNADREFIRRALEEIRDGNRVVYYSWW